jgi:predicted alpha/beta superfamily hydrolase
MAACSVSCARKGDALRASTATRNVSVLPQPLAMPGLGRSRALRVYLPPSYERGDRRYPVIYMHDGQNLFDDASAYAGEWGVDEAMNELARTRGFEAIVVGIDNGRELRDQEMIPWPLPTQRIAEGAAYTAFVVETVKPWIDAHYRTLAGRETTAMVGSSYGALITHYALLHYPQTIGKAAILSPSYYVSNDIFEETAAHPWPSGTRTWFYIGGQEYLDGKPGETENVPDVARMLSLLAGQQHLPSDIALSAEPRAHHNEAAWSKEFPRAIEWLFKLGEVTAPAAR